MNNFTGGGGLEVALIGIVKGNSSNTPAAREEGLLNAVNLDKAQQGP